MNRFASMIFLVLIAAEMGCLAVEETGKTGREAWWEAEPAPLTIIYPKKEAATNPPFIHWQKSPEADHYRINITSASEEWSVETPWNFYTPEIILPEGQAVLQIQSCNVEGAFLKQSETQEIILPPASVLLGGSLNHLSAEPGTLFYPTEEQLQQIRQSQDPERVKYRQGLLQHASSELPDIIKNLQEPPLYPDSGWDLEIWKLKNNTCFALRDVLLSRALAFRLTADEQYLNEMRPLLMQAAGWDPRGSTGLWENDHAAQSLLFSFSVALSLLRDHLAPEEIALVEQSIQARAENMYAFHNPFVPKVLSQGLMNVPENNHAWFTAASLGIAGMTLSGRAEQAPEWLSFSAQLYRGVFLPFGGSQGEWHEGIDYWSYTLYFLFQYADALRQVTPVDFYRHPWLEETALFKIYTHPPSGAYVPFGDCRNRAPNHFDKVVMLRLASRYDDPRAWAWVNAIDSEIRGGYYYDSLLWHENGPSARSGTALSEQFPYARHFQDIGWVVLNSDPLDAENRLLFAVRCGTVIGNGAHSHGDQNHFILNAGGDGLIVDAGYYDSYFSPHHKEYSSTTQAHNAILVDGSGQQAFTAGADGQVVRFEVEGENVFIQGHASKPIIYNGQLRSWVRSLEFLEEEKLIVRDDILPATPARLSWLLHSDFPIQFDAEKNEVVIRGKRYELRGRFTSEHPVEALFTKGFPIEPALSVPDQYHLELKTTETVTSWTPHFEARLSPIISTGSQSP